jgi:peptide deformylase
MSIGKVIQIGDPALKAKNNKINVFNSKELDQLVTDLKDTMTNEGLIGMAAPQIFENYQVFVTQPRKTDGREGSAHDEFRVYINSKVAAVFFMVNYLVQFSVRKQSLFRLTIKPEISSS